VFDRLVEADFLPENRGLYGLLSQTTAKTQPELMLEVFRQGGFDSELLSAINEWQYLPLGKVESLISELKNLVDFQKIKTLVSKVIETNEKTADSFTLANELIDAGKMIVEGGSGWQLNDYKELIHWADTVGEPFDCFTFGQFPFMDTFKLRGGHVVALSGMYKSGKTSIALAMAFEQESKGEKFGYVSAEMTLDMIRKKFFAYKFDIPNYHLEDKTLLSPNAKRLIVEYIQNEYKKNPLFYFSIDSKLTLGMVHKFIRHQAGKGVKFIVVDYFQRIRLPNGKYNTRVEELDHISDCLISYAKEYDVCLLVISQMNRGGFTEGNSSNSAGSLALNRDADFLFNIMKPSEMLVNKGKVAMKIDMDNIPFTKYDFLLELERSRHSLGGVQALLTRERSGRLTTKYENFTRNLSHDFDPTGMINALTGETAGF